MTAVAEGSSFGQRVQKVVVEYSESVDAASLSTDDFMVEDSGYNFRFDDVSELPNLVEREVVDVYTTSDPALLLENDRPEGEYPVVISLSGHGMGYDGQNRGVHLVADMPATAWFQEEWTGTDEDVIVLAPQNERVGKEIEGAQVIELVEDFSARFAVDTDRIYATSVSYGSQLMWEMFSERPDLFGGGLLTGGFPGDENEFAPIAEAEIPMWITHGTNDHLLGVEDARASFDLLVAAYEERGLSDERIAELALWTEYGNDDFSLPDYHLAAAPTYEDPTILQWLLAQDAGLVDDEDPNDDGGNVDDDDGSTDGGTDDGSQDGAGDGTNDEAGNGSGASGNGGQGNLATTGPEHTGSLIALVTTLLLAGVVLTAADARRRRISARGPEAIPR